MPPRIRIEPFDVANRLEELGLSRDGLLEVLQSIFGEYGYCNENDPGGTKGWTVYRWGVRGLREQYRSKGWVPDNTGNLETIVNHDLKIRVAVLNTDDHICDRDRVPRNSTEKGPNSERAALANADMLPGVEDWPLMRADGQPAVTPEYDTWHLCVYVRDDELTAELSLLTKFSGGYFLDAGERIFLVRPGEWKPHDRRTSDGGSDVADNVIDFDIERKKK